MTTKWKAPEQTPERIAGVHKLMEEQEKVYGFSKPMVEYLYNKGIRSVEEIEDLIDISVDMERSPYELKDMEKAAKIISNHIDSNSRIIVFGDYDTDGITGTSIMVRALRNVGADVDYFINHRFIHGYGISVDAVKDMILEKGAPDLIITVDNGIVGFEGIQFAVDQGIDVVVTDHHLAKEELPNASAVVNPHRLDDTSTFKDICGATVAYKVMFALYHLRGLPFDYIYDMRDLVALGTVGDIMPLVDENRWLVTQGLDLIGRERREQFSALRRAKQGDKPFKLDGDLFGFLLSPMMNAPSRLTGSPNIGVDFFLTDDVDEMDTLAEEIVDLNEQRKALTLKQMAIAEEIVDTDSDNVIVAYHPDFHQGIIGLIAGRLTNKYNKPAIVFAPSANGVIKGSSRSIESYNIKEAFDRIADQLVSYGGHAQAAGLSVMESNFDNFKQAIVADASKLTEEELTPTAKVDVVLSPDEITAELIHEMNRFSPYGHGFEKPSFGLHPLNVDSVTFMTDGQHAKIIGDNGMNVLLFSGGEYVRELGTFSNISAIGSPSLNTFMGRTSVQFIVDGHHLVAR